VACSGRDALNRTLAIYRDLTQAARAARRLLDAGVDGATISLLVGDHAAGQQFVAGHRVRVDGRGRSIGWAVDPARHANALSCGPISRELREVRGGELRPGLIGLGVAVDDAADVAARIAGGGVLVAVDWPAGSERGRIARAFAGRAAKRYEVLQPQS